MKIFPFSLALTAAALLASVASAQFGLDLNKINKGLETAKAGGKMLKGVAGIGPKEEALIGDSVALEIIGKYGGVVRDKEIMHRVNLVGRAMALYSERPEREWRFAVLDSPSVNAFSAPDGYVFITRGLYDKATSDDVLAGILAHEIAHITERHALNIVARGDFLSGASDLVSLRSSDARALNQQLAQFDLGIGQITKALFEKGFDPQTEFGADKTGYQLAATTGYAPGGLRAALVGLQQSGADRRTTFSTHPPLQDRIKRLPNDPAPAAAASAASATPISADDEAFAESAKK